MRDGGKGDKPRPIPDRKKFEDNWNKIFENAKKLEERMKKEIDRKLFDDFRN